MKVALVKSSVDVAGPWSSVKWGDDLKSVWGGKASLILTTQALKADWYVIKDRVSSRYYKQLKDLGYWSITERYTKNITDEIPFDDYDVVISMNPILKPPRNSNTLFAYYVSETFDWLYQFDVLNGYDLMLDHMVSSRREISSLPQVLGFPFLYRFEWHSKDTRLWIDFRTDEKFDGVDTDMEVADKSTFNNKPYGIHDPPMWGDGFDYLEKLSGCKYYIGIGRDAGPGQALAEAASFGCICFGGDRKYHKIICHPFCFCSKPEEAFEKIEEIERSEQMQREIINYQKEQLNFHFCAEPMNALRNALRIKRSPK